MFTNQPAKSLSSRATTRDLVNIATWLDAASSAA